LCQAGKNGGCLFIGLEGGICDLIEVGFDLSQKRLEGVETRAIEIQRLAHKEFKHHTTRGEGGDFAAGVLMIADSYWSLFAEASFSLLNSVL
jgi:hypothetical protein